MLAWLYWDPSPELLILPFINIPITWYGLLFAIGFWLGLQIFTHIFKNFIDSKGISNSSAIANTYSERLLLYVIVATVLGARLGHILFYEHPMEYFANPISILKTWEGGLASHGAIVAIVIAVLLFSLRTRKEFPDFGFLKLLDSLAIPAMLVGALIRIGNFMNQEILGTTTDKPWGIIFGHPRDGGGISPRHPAQLYEAIFYFALFLLLLSLWSFKKEKIAPGRIAGINLFSTFTFRFLIEFIKEGQSIWFDSPDVLFVMGQILSIPIALFGLYLLLKSPKLEKNKFLKDVA